MFQNCICFTAVSPFGVQNINNWNITSSWTNANFDVLRNRVVNFNLKPQKCPRAEDKDFSGNEVDIFGIPLRSFQALSTVFDENYLSRLPKG